MKHCKRFLSLLLTSAVLLCLLPTTAFATTYFNSDTTIEEGNYGIMYSVDDDIVIEEGVTLTFSESVWDFDLGGYVLTNYGKIVGPSTFLAGGYSGIFYNYGVYQFEGVGYLTMYDLTLRSLALSSGTLSPSFSAAAREYTADVDRSTDSIQITPTLNNEENIKSITVNGATASNGAASTVSLDYGENVITIVITADDGNDTTNTYTVTVTRNYICSSCSSYTNGFCDSCGGYEPAVLNNGTYEISNAGQLFWFASLVNGYTTQKDITAAVPDANAVLKNDIDLSVTTSTHTSKEWTPIGSEAAPFSGTFDGSNYTVSGMSITTAADYIGLFGYVTGTVENMTVNGSIIVNGNTMNVGGIAGTVNNGTLSHLTSGVRILDYDSTKGCAGGIAAEAAGTDGTSGSTVEYCVYKGSLSAVGTLDCIGGIVGYMNAAAIDNCANLGTVDTTYGTAAASAGIYTGGIVSYCNNSNSVITNCYNYGTVNGAGESTSDDCYTGAIIGRINKSIGSLTNCYYLNSNSIDGVGANGSGSKIDANSKTSSEFSSGEVAWLLQSSQSSLVWGQSISSDAYPVLTDDTSKRVVKISFYHSANGAAESTAFEYGYINNGQIYESYPADTLYVFYSDADLTNQITDTSTYIFDTDDNTCSVYAALLGDVDNDGDLDNVDAVLLLKHLSGILTLTNNQLALCDCNMDNIVDLTDTTAILKMIQSE